MKDTTELFIARNVAMWRLLTVILMMTIAFILAACGDDESSFAPRDIDDSSSSICNDCDNESSSSVTPKSSSSSKVPEPVEPVEGSSSSAKSCSSAKSSSSSSLPEGSVDPATVLMGTLLDERDNHTYKTITIGTQTWMAENLRYSGPQPTKTLDSSSFCYDGRSGSCEVYGRLYWWSAAMDSAGTWSTNGMGCGSETNCSPTYPVRGVCPEGWHLPDTTDWITLFNAVGGDSIAGKMLKYTSIWDSDDSGKDAYSFTALPAGVLENKKWRFVDKGYGACFWSYAEGASKPYYMDLGGNSSAELFFRLADHAYSVRCVKDEVAIGGTAPVRYVEPFTVVPGSMTDERDGQTYKTVTIGTHTWMAENLNYAYTDVPYSYDGSTSDSTSWCYNDSAEYCAKYGRLYTWAAAMDSVGTWSTNGKGCGAGTTCSPTYPVRGICPEGWHLPDTVETDMLLFTEVGGYSIAGKMLKSTSGWDENGNGTDAYSFAMLPAGYKTVRGYYGMGGSADFWVSSGYWGFNDMLAISLNSYEEDASVVGTSKYYGFPVRCVKDDD